MLSPLIASRWMAAAPHLHTPSSSEDHAMTDATNADSNKMHSVLKEATPRSHPPEIPPIPTIPTNNSNNSANNTLHLASPHSQVRSPDDASTVRSPSYHARRLSGGSTMQDETPTSGTSSLTSTSHVRQMSTDSSESVSSNSASPLAPHHYTRTIGFSFTSPTPQSSLTNSMEDVVTPISHVQTRASKMEEDQTMTDEVMTAATDSMKITHTAPARHGTTTNTPMPNYSQLPNPAYGSSNSHSSHSSHSNHGHQSHHTSNQRAHHPSNSHHSTPSHSPNIGPVASSSGASMKRGQGFSCHHCKTHKMPELLLFCSNQSKKGPGKKRCRKKYCDSCLKRLYGHPVDQPLSEVVGFQCPACLGNCVCAGCERKAAPAPAASESSDSGGGAVSSNSSTHSASPVPTLSVGGSPSPSREKDRGQAKPTTPQGKPPGKKRRTSIDTGIAATEEDIKQETEESTNTTESMTIATPLLTHGRRSSGEFSIPNTFHLPQPSSLPFTLPTHSSLPLSSLPPRVGSNSTTTSPRLTALASPSNRMIHVPLFSLQSPLLNPVVGGTAGSIYSSTIQQSVAAATSAAAHVTGFHGALDLSGSDPMHTGVGGMLESTTAGPHSATSVSPNTSPFSTPRTTAMRPPSAFSPISTIGATNSAPITPEIDVTAGAFSNHTISPSVSPSIIKRLILTNTDVPTTAAAVGIPPSSILTTPLKPLAHTVVPLASVPAPTVSPENELMKVLANVACSTATTTNAALPPAHPVKAEPSPKLGYLTNTPLLLSPTHPLTLPPPAVSSLSSSSSLASISAMKAQHIMEVQCLLQQQQQQLAELELRAMKELEAQQHQQHSILHQQRIAQAGVVKSPLLGSTPPPSRPNSTTPIQTAGPIQMGTPVKLEMTNVTTNQAQTHIPAAAPPAAVAAATAAAVKSESTMDQDTNMIDATPHTNTSTSAATVPSSTMIISK